jgi:hypothetical protein
MTSTNVMNLLKNPLAMTMNQGDFFSLVLAECARYGVPGNAIALFRDIHAMLGHSKPLAEKQISALAGPLVAWRTDPRQPHFERVLDIERLAFHQRALIAFGGGKPGEMVGRAEICHAMGNILRGTSPPEYWEVFQWATIDTMAEIEGVTPERALKDREKDGFKAIPDADVIQPGGRLYATYQEVCTSIRREAIAGLERQALGHPRAMLRPMAAQALANHPKLKAELLAEGRADIAELLDRQMEQMLTMFPGLGTIDEEVSRHNLAVIKGFTEALE